MYQSFNISNFRCFKNLNVTNLERVNLIAGVNNVGKTALLEALFLHCGAYNPHLTMDLNALRGIESIKVELGQMIETPWDSLFYEFDISKEIQLIGDDKTTGVRKLQLDIIRDVEGLMKVSQLIQHDINWTKETSLSLESPQVLELSDMSNGQNSYYLILDHKGIRGVPIPPPPPFPTIYLGSMARVPLSEEASRFGKLELNRQLNVLTNALKVVEPRLDDLSIIVVGDTPLIHGDIGLERFVPLQFMGEGMARLANFVLAIANSPDGVVLIDEIENGFHHSILTKVWQVIGEMARKFNTQVFATTHSLECIMSAHKAFMESEHYDFSLHRLERINEAIDDVPYDQNALEAAIEIGLEVR